MIECDRARKQEPAITASRAAADNACIHTNYALSQAQQLVNAGQAGTAESNDADISIGIARKSGELMDYETFPPRRRVGDWVGR